MHFMFTDEQRMMAEAAQTLLAHECTPAHLRAEMKAGTARDEQRWRRISEMGLTAVLAPEALGGLGLNACDFVLIAESAGYTALPDPLIEHAGVAVPLLCNFAEDQRARPYVERAIQGEITVAAGPAINPFVANADTATLLLLEHAGEVHMVQREAVQLTRQESVDPFRRLFKVDWQPSAATRLADSALGNRMWQQALDRATLFTAAQCVGLAQRCNEIATAYAKERCQFGRAIGTNQAIKHLLANVQVRIEFTKPVVYAAAAQLPTFDRFSRARASHAKLAAIEAVDQSARTAVQVHGAMGYSWEVDVHFFLKRGLALANSWGTPAFHRTRVAERVFTLPTGPEYTFTSETRHG